MESIVSLKYPLGQAPRYPYAQMCYAVTSSTTVHAMSFDGERLCLSLNDDYNTLVIHLTNGNLLALINSLQVITKDLGIVPEESEPESPPTSAELTELAEMAQRMAVDPELPL